MSFPFWQNSILRIPLAISLGAISGALSRYYLTIWLTKLFGSNFPFGTLFVNLTGSFFMGLFITMTAERAEKLLQIPPEVFLLVTVGFLGSYTTFSSYELDSIRLFYQGKKQLMVLYWLASPILGLICLKLGIMLADWILD
jgi:CrcB protein